jgi:hypothetical protein
MYVECHGIRVLFPGDLEKAGWEKMLTYESFREVLKKMKVFVASRHGRDSGVCHDLYGDQLCSPYYVVISDKGYEQQRSRLASSASPCCESPRPSPS